MREEGDVEATEDTVDPADWGYSRFFKGAPGRIESWRQSYDGAVDTFRQRCDVEALLRSRRRLYHKVGHQVSYRPETDRDRDALMTAHALLHRMSVEVAEIPWDDTFKRQIDKYVKWGIAGGRDLYVKATRPGRSNTAEAGHAGLVQGARPIAPRIGLETGIGVRVRLTRAFYDRAAIWYLSMGDSVPIEEARRLALGLMSFHLEHAARTERENVAFLEAGAFLARLGREFQEIDWPEDRRRRLGRLLEWAHSGGQNRCEPVAE